MQFLFLHAAIRKSQTIIPADEAGENTAENGQSFILFFFSNSLSLLYVLMSAMINCAGSRKDSEPNGCFSEDEGRKRGMILPFQPLIMTFHKVNYFVDMPKVQLLITIFFLLELIL